MLVGLPQLSVAKVVITISRAHQFGLGQPLHAHVCHPGYGRIWSKSQEDRPEQEQDPVSVL